VSGMTRPEAVVCSASTCLMTMRSSSGLMETDTAYLFLITTSKTGLAHSLRECQNNCTARLALVQRECQREPHRLVPSQGETRSQRAGSPPGLPESNVSP